MGKRVGVEAAAEATGLAKWELRQGAIAGRYPHMRVGDSKHGKIIFDLDILEEHIRNRMLQSVNSQGGESHDGYGKLRKVY